jgi:uncharacterized protein YjbI with pentapeptide repeats
VGGLSGQRLELRADCTNCSGLCCVALTFTKSADFAIDKDAGKPCPNLQTDFLCGIHTRLRPAGFKGCTVFDCFGAGQQVAQVTYRGRDWRQHPETAGQMFAVFTVMRQLHELLWYLEQALDLVPAGTLRTELDLARLATETLTRATPIAILELDLVAHRADIDVLLTRISESVRSGPRGAGKLPKKVQPGADLIGANLRGVDLSGANLRGAYLIAADLRDTDLSRTDLIGADLRDADLRGANLTISLFLTQSQVNSAKGNRATRLPLTIDRPAHWA